MAVLFIQLSVPSLNAQWTKSTLFDDSDMALDLAEASSFQKYPTYDQYLDMMQGFASDYPEICRLDTIGLSTEGRLLLALKISDQVQEDEAEAAFLYSSTMHGNEIVGYVLLLRLADTLLKGYGSDSEITALLDNLQIWINPMANPDGSFSAGNNLSLEQAIRLNANGVDLNRDFPVATRGEADDTTGRELETRNMMLFHRDKAFTLSANIHSGTEVVNYPWDDRAVLHADDAWYRFISREYADETMAVDPDYMWGWPDNGITNGWAWYQALGTRQDYVNYYLGGREVTLELSDEFLLPSAELENHWNINQRSLINYMSQCLYGIRGRVSDLESGDPILSQIFVESHDSSYSAVHSAPDHGDFYRLIKEGSYDLVVSAPGYFTDTIRSVSVTDYQATLLDIQLQSYPASVPLHQAPAFRIYPNPAIHSFMLEAENIPHGELELSLFSLDGRTVFHQIHTYSGSGIELSTRQIKAGIYLLRCTIANYSQVDRLVVLKP
jgi:hypothetical protein